MKILVSGCSFTQWPAYPGGPNTCWPEYMKKLGYDITCIGEAAAGNQYICDSVIRETLNNKYDLVLVMWSGVSRLDYLTSLEDPAWEQLFDSYGFYRRVNGADLGYIFSGGRIGTWFKHPVAHKMFYEMYKVSSDLSLATINLQEMVKLQSHLRAQGLDYRFMSYINYWGSGENLSPNGDFGVADHPELKLYTNALDWSKWIFTEGKDGIYEMAIANNDLQADKFHPDAKTQEAWANIVSERLK